MTKSEVNEYVGKNVRVQVDNGSDIHKILEGVLKKGNEEWFFSKGRYFIKIGYAENYYFRASHIIKIEVLNDK